MRTSKAPGPRPEDRRDPSDRTAVEPFDAFEDPATDGPFALVAALEGARPKIRAEAVLWFVGVVLVLAGSLYFTQSNWDRWSADVRSLVVTAGLVGYQALFVGLAALLAKRRAPALPTRVFAGLGAALVPMIGWASAGLFGASWYAAIALSGAASLLVVGAARVVNDRAARLAIPAATAMLALTLCRSPAMWVAATAAMALGTIVWAVRSVDVRTNRILACGYGLYLAFAVTVGAATHPEIAPAWPTACALATFAWVVDRTASKAGVARIVIIIASAVAMPLVLTSDLVPIAGRIAVLITAALCTTALASTARRAERRLPLALAIVSGLFVYFFLPAPFRAVVDLALASAKSALGYEDQPLPIAYYGITFVPYLFGWWALASRLGERLERTARRVLFVIAFALVAIAVAAVDPRPALFTLPLYTVAMAYDALRTKSVVAKHSASLLVVALGVRTALAAGVAWPVGLVASAALFAVLAGRSRTAALYGAATATIAMGAAFAVGLVHIPLIDALPIHGNAALMGTTALTMAWIANRVRQPVLAGVAIGGAALAGTLAVDPHVALTIGTVVTLAIALHPGRVFGHAARTLLPFIGLVTIFVGLAVEASWAAHLVAASVGLATPVVTKRPIWSLVGLFGTAVVASKVALLVGAEAPLVLAALAAASAAIVPWLPTAPDAPRHDRYRDVITAGSALLGLFAVAASLVDVSPMVALHVALILAGPVVLRYVTPKNHAASVVAIVGLVVASFVPSPHWVTLATVVPLAALVLRGQRDDRARTAIVVAALVSVVVVWPSLATLAIAAGALLATSRQHVVLRVVAGAAAALGAAATFGLWGVLVAIALGTPLAIHGDHSRSSTVVGVVCAALMALAWPALGPAAPVLAAPAVVLLAAPLYMPRHVLTPLVAGVGLVLLADTATVLGVGHAVSFTIATLVAAGAARLWTLRAEVGGLLALADTTTFETNRATAARVARMVTIAIGAAAIALVVTSGSVSALTATWVALLGALVFAASGQQFASPVPSRVGAQRS